MFQYGLFAPKYRAPFALGLTKGGSFPLWFDKLTTNGNRRFPIPPGESGEMETRLSPAPHESCRPEQAAGQSEQPGGLRD